METNKTKLKSNSFILDNYGKKATVTKLISSAFVNLFASLTVLFFSPTEVFLGNANEFIFSLSEFWHILLIYSLLVAAVLTAVSLALPKKASLFMNIFIFALGLGAYIQAMFLNGAMGSLTGDEDAYSYTTVYVNLGIWIFIIAALIVATALCLKFGKAETFKKGVFFVAAALTVMQLTAFVSSAFTTDSATRYFYLSNKNQYELSADKNTVVFIIDTCDGFYVDKLMNENPEVLEELDGFIYYPDAVATHSRTYPSLPYLLTGEICHFDKPYDTFINEAFEKSNYIPDIYKTGCNIGLYTDNQYLGNSGAEFVENAKEYDGNSKMSVGGIMLWMSRMSLYRNVPYICKSVFNYTDMQINNNCVNIPDACYSSQDMELYNGLVEQGLDITSGYDKAFRLYHLWGAHPGGNFDRNMNKTSKATPYESVLGDFKLIGKYIKEMKMAGIYDNSTIIITADHGFSGGTSAAKPLEIDSPVRSLMMVKPAGTQNKIGMTTSNAQVCHADLFATVVDSFGGNTSDYGKTIFEYGENEQRTRLYYHTMMYSDISGEVALREYAITGDSRDFNNWKLTGKYWDVLYSERAVSRHRLKEVLK